MSEKQLFQISPATKAMAETLRGEDRPAATAIASILECIDVLSQEVRWQSTKLLEVEIQTIKTNGRVTKLESVNVSQSNFFRGVKWILGGIAAILIFVVPMTIEKLTYLLKLDDEYIIQIKLPAKK